MLYFLIRTNEVQFVKLKFASLYFFSICHASDSISGVTRMRLHIFSSHIASIKCSN